MISLLFWPVYLVLVIAVNVSLLDLFYLQDPAGGVAELDRLSRSVSALAPGFLIARSVVRRLQTRGTPRAVIGAAGAGAFIAAGFLVSRFLRSVAEFLVGLTDAAQQSAAIMAVVATHALSTGALSVPTLGFSPARADPVAKTAVVFFVPYLAVTGGLSQLQERGGDLVAGSVVRGIELGRPRIETQLTELCRFARERHAFYLEKSKEVTSHPLPGLAERYAFRYRDQVLRYNGTLPLGLDWNGFIRHNDIQGIIRERFLSILSRSPHTAQLDYIMPRGQMLTWLIKLFDRKIIDPCIGWDDFMLEYGGPLGVYMGRQVVAALRSDHSAEIFSSEGFRSVGERAIYGLLVPPLGLIWTLGGAVIALLNITAAAVGRVLPGRAPIVAAVAAAALAILAAPMLAGNALVESGLILPGLARLSAQYGLAGSLAATGIEWILRVEPLIYPPGILAKTLLAPVLQYVPLL